MISDDFIKYMKTVENESLLLTGSPTRHPSPEGGNDTIGYGHKLSVLEDATNQVYGFDLDQLTEAQCEFILVRDIANRVGTLRQRLGRARWDSLSDRQQEILVEYEYHVGQVERIFPKFTAAVQHNDIAGMRAEYERYYRDKKGRTKPLTRRNEQFYERYLA